jgi:hypothetical protein
MEQKKQLRTPSARQPVTDEMRSQDAVTLVRAAQNEFDLGLGRPAREAFAELRAKYGVPD